jgi:hypothetical protein
VRSDGLAVRRDEDRPAVTLAEDRGHRNGHEVPAFPEHDARDDAVAVPEPRPDLGRIEEAENDSRALLLNAECGDLGDGRGVDPLDFRPFSTGPPQPSMVADALQDRPAPHRATAARR